MAGTLRPVALQNGAIGLWEGAFPFAFGQKPRDLRASLEAFGHFLVAAVAGDMAGLRFLVAFGQSHKAFVQILLPLIKSRRILRIGKRILGRAMSLRRKDY